MNQARGALTAEIHRKRKERDDFFLPSVKSNNNHHVRGKQVQLYGPPNTTSSKPLWSNRLLAGYMAHEFLSQGTLLGQKFDPAQSQFQAQPKKKSSPEQSSSGPSEESKSYAEVASLLKTDGAHIPGIVNPSQLARWIQM